LLRGITGLLSCKNPTFYLDKNPTHFKKNSDISVYYTIRYIITRPARSWSPAAPSAWSKPRAEGNSLEELHLKEFNRPVLAVEILRWREETEKVEVAAAEAPRRRQPS
jgi:hypothetical protein